MSYERCDGCGTAVDVGAMIRCVPSQKLYHWCCQPGTFVCDDSAYHAARRAIEVARCPAPPTLEAP